MCDEVEHRGCRAAEREDRIAAYGKLLGGCQKEKRKNQAGKKVLAGNKIRRLGRRISREDCGTQ